MYSQTMEIRESFAFAESCKSICSTAQKCELYSLALLQKFSPPLVNKILTSHSNSFTRRYAISGPLTAATDPVMANRILGRARFRFVEDMVSTNVIVIIPGLLRLILRWSYFLSSIRFDGCRRVLSSFTSIGCPH